MGVRAGADPSIDKMYCKEQLAPSCFLRHQTAPEQFYGITDSASHETTHFMTP